MIEYHRYINIDNVRNNPSEPWNKFHLSKNKQLTVKDVETLILPNSIRDWDWDIISQYINIQEVRNNTTKPWNKWWLSFNETLTIKDVETLILPNSKDKWNWDWITMFIDIQEIINNPNNPWSRDGLKKNKGYTPKMLELFNAGLLKHLQKNIPQFKYHTDMIIKCEC